MDGHRPWPRGSDAAGDDADFTPGLVYHDLFVAAGTVKAAGDIDGCIGEILELRVGPGVLRQRLIPDVSRSIPRVAADVHGSEVESVVGNSGIDVHAAVVAEASVRHLLKVVHGCRLRI